MSVTVDPRTVDKLQAFAERRRRLILERGLCAFLGSLIVIMSVLALFDRLVILPDAVRWTLSGIGYGAVLLVLWQTCMRFMVHRTGFRELARMIEHADPSLREDLIAAVELGEQKNAEGNRWDSEQFRALVQRDVARRIKEVEVNALLPQKLVAPWLRGAMAAVILLIVLLLIPGLHFPKLLGRALLPGANLERPSDIIVTFLEPSPADRIVASGDTVDLLVSVEGGRVDKVILETSGSDGEEEKIKLTRREGGRYAGAISVNRFDVRYRVRAKGTITRFHTLESRPRPEILEFAKVYHYPEYSGIPDVTAREDHGDLSALEGSKVDLELKVNQKIEKAELLLASSSRQIEDKVVLLEASGDGLLRGSILLDNQFQSYRVELKAAASGFTNKFSPDYELRAVPDLVPAVRMTAPVTNREVAVNATLPVTGSASDDVGLARIFQAWRIGQDEWQERLLAEAMGPSAEIAGEWNLRGLPIKAGDTLFTRLIAEDTKGNRGESTIVRLAVTSEDTDTEEREWAEKEKAFAKQTDALRRQLGEMGQAVGEAKKAAKESGQPELGVEEQQKIARAQAAVAEARHQAERVWEELDALRADAPGRAEERELRAAAAVIAAVRNQKLDPLAERIADWATKPKAEWGRGDDIAESEAWEAHSEAARIATMERALAAEDLAEVLENDSDRVAERQREVAEASERAQNQRESAEALEAVKAQQEIAGTQTRELEEALLELAEVADGGEQTTARQMAEQLKREREELEQALAAEVPDRNQLRQQADELKNRAEEGARQMDNLRKGLASRADQAREEMMRNQPGPTRELADLEGVANELVRKQEQIANERNPEQASRLAEEAAGMEEALVAGLEATADQLRDLADYEQGGPNPKRQWSADLENAAQAADALAAKVDEATSPEVAKELAATAKALKDAVEAVDVGATTEELAESVREWRQGESGSAAARRENAEAGQAALAEMRALPKALEQVEGAKEAVQRAGQAANSQEANQLNDELREREQAELRGDENRQPQSMQQQASALQEQLEGISEQIEPQVAAARAALENMAPTVPEQLRALAREVQAQAEHSADLAETAENAAGEGANAEESDARRTSEEVAAQAAEILGQSEETGERMEEIAGALAAEAGIEDLLSSESRERARDADDAIAQLNEVLPEAVSTSAKLAEAAAAASASEQAGALQSAAGQQRGLAESLGELADQLESLDQGGEGAEEARMALRGSEERTGVAEALDQAYEQASELADLLDETAVNPQEALAALEQELQRNQPMQESLGDIARSVVESAAESLEQAAASQSQLGDALEQAMGDHGQMPGEQGRMEDAAHQQGQIGEQVAQAGEELSRAGRHEERLGNEALGEALSETGQQTEAVAEEQAAEAAQALAANQSQAAASEKVGAAESAIRARAQEAAALAGEPSSSGQGSGKAPSEPSPPQKASGSPQSVEGSPAPSLDPDQDGMIGPFDPTNIEQAGFLAEALDSLDQALASGALPSGRTPASSELSQGAGPSPQGESQGSPAAAPPGEKGPGPSSPSAPAARGAPESSQGQSQAQAALASAARAQAQAMAMARSQGMTPGSPSSQPGQPMTASSTSEASQQSKGSQVGVAEVPRKLVAAPEGAQGKAPAPADWSKLPSKVAKDLLEGQRQDMSPEYRSAIENYYKAIAEKAGRKSQQ